MKKQKSPKFEVDFFLLEILTEACWHAGTSVRSMFLEELVEVHYHKMNEQQRNAFWAFMDRFKTEPSNQFNKDVQELVFCRFEPERQFEVATNFNGKIETHKAFLMNDKYHVSKNRHIEPKFIIKSTRIDGCM